MYAFQELDLPQHGVIEKYGEVFLHPNGLMPSLYHYNALPTVPSMKRLEFLPSLDKLVDILCTLHVIGLRLSYCLLQVL